MNVIDKIRQMAGLVSPARPRLKGTIWYTFQYTGSLEMSVRTAIAGLALDCDIIWRKL